MSYPVVLMCEKFEEVTAIIFEDAYLGKGGEVLI